MGRRLAVQYFALQAVAIAAWWVLLLFIPGANHLFVPHGVPSRSIGAFLPGDVVLIVGSLLVAWGNRSTWAAPLAWTVAGAMVYATSMTVVHWTLGTITALSALLMILAGAGSIAAALALTRSVFHEAVPAGPIT